MIFGHIPATFVLVKVMRPHISKANLTAVLIGCYSPDLLDKPLSLVGLTSQRGLGHSLVFSIGISLVILGICKWMSSRDWASVLKWFLFGHWLHLAEDLVSPQVLFWPLLGDFPDYGAFNFKQIMVRFFLHQEFLHIFIIEMMAYAAFIIYWIVYFKKKRNSAVIIDKGINKSEVSKGV